MIFHINCLKILQDFRNNAIFVSKVKIIKMFKINFRLFSILFLWLFMLVSASGQLSVFNKIDTFKGYNSQTIALDDGFLVFNNPQNYNDTIKFRLTKFNKNCSNVEWIHDYRTDSLTGNYDPDAIKINDEIFLLLKAKKEANKPELLTLVKITSGGNLIWAKNYYTNELKINSYTANLLKQTNSKFLYIVSGDQKGNTAIISIDPANGSIANSKLVKNIRHNSSTFDQDGNLFIFSADSLYAKLRINTSKVDSVIWAKKIKNRFFASVNDPLPIQSTTGNRVATVIIDTLLRRDTTFNQTGLDTAIYKLVAFDFEGSIKLESDGFIGPDYKVWPVELKYNSVVDKESLYIMTKNRVGFYSNDLKKTLDAKYYKFQKDTFAVVDASLELLDDKSLLMSGFCYKKAPNNEFNILSPYLFVSKTQPNFIILPEEPVCLKDSSDKAKVTMISTKIESVSLKDSLVNFYLTDQKFKTLTLDITKFHEAKCGKVIMNKTEEVKEFCPGDAYPMSVEWLLWADYKWNTGEETNSVVKNKPGVYTVTVTLCDTVKISKFEYKLSDDVDACFSVLIPEAFIPNDQNDSLNMIFRSYQKRSFPYSSYSLKVFDRWGEKVFETADYTEGWDGNFRGNPMPAGVYLYRLDWEAVFFEKTYKNPKPNGQVLLLR